MTPACPVCNDSKPEQFAVIAERSYWRCTGCGATFLDPALLPDPATESARYRLHHNDPNDPGWRAFLNRLTAPLLSRLGPATKVGLDFGCGRCSVLAVPLAAAGHWVWLYDPLFFPDTDVLNQTYDYIICTEVAEHFHRPAEEFRRLDRLLRPGGWLALMTRLLGDDRSFADWSYRRDPTHVVFYRPETFGFICRELGWRLDEIIPPDMVFIQKPPADHKETT